MDENRYSRQTLFSPIGKEGQEELSKKHVLIIGAGALGSSSAEMLVRSGIGKVTLVDRDYVEESNLQRQQLYTEKDAKNRTPKAIASENRLKEINANCLVNGIVGEATVELLESLILDVDLMMDATDNMEIRMIMNDLAVKHGVPWIYGACVGSSGMTFTIVPEQTPCLHCILQRLPVHGMSCDTVGIISPAVQMVVVHQVTEALKILINDIESLRSTFYSFDLWNNISHNIKMNRVKKTTCTTCGENRLFPFLEKENQTKTAVLCGRDTVQVRPPSEKNLDFSMLAESLKNRGYQVTSNPFLLNVQLKENRLVLFKDGRALVHHTKDIMYAKTLYDQLLG
ncbi:ThiF family adenylyltransferase [Bacillus sp. B1-b2]|uniref:ThiF family adenylyltransferase n=1 Tax=Bacillus sp. B1-b2 TaxID=2653201 RepID=UPI001261BD5A|nr:ThiF family adenylyltransferase [Bacillus sp. B1-b2]KAB7670634.1 thiamine biosynthesis protein MoeB [Bacillus sp. B1-b2]